VEGLVRQRREPCTGGRRRRRQRGASGSSRARLQPKQTAAVCSQPTLARATAAPAMRYLHQAGATGSARAAERQTFKKKVPRAPLQSESATHTARQQKAQRQQLHGVGAADQSGGRGRLGSTAARRHTSHLVTGEPLRVTVSV